MFSFYQIGVIPKSRGHFFGNFNKNPSSTIPFEKKSNTLILAFWIDLCDFHKLYFFMNFRALWIILKLSPDHRFLA